jgi:hypothetical protein
MGCKAPWERWALCKRILLLRGVAWARLVLRGGSLAWALAVIWSLTRPSVHVEETVGIMILGGGILFLLGKTVQGWEKAIRRECRCLSKELFHAGQVSHPLGSAKLLVYCLLQGDAKRFGRSDLRKRVQRFLESSVQILQEGGMHRHLWLNAISALLWTLESAGAHWAGKSTSQRIQARATDLFLEFRDEDILDLLLASIVGISALFRFHLWVWGMPTQGFGRGSISVLRRSWLPFCAMEPTEVTFPPPLPRGLKETLSKDPVLANGKELCQAWLTWLGKGQGLQELMQRISSR